MKKILLGVFSLICLFTLIGCQNNDPVINNDDELIEQYKQQLQQEIDKSIPTEISGRINLMKEFEFEDGTVAEIKWESSNPQVVSKLGSFNQGIFDEEITLTANIEIINNYGDNICYEYKVTSLTKGLTTVEEYKKVIEKQIPDYVYTDVTFVTKEATYKEKNIFANITYKSSNPEVLTADGKYLNQNPNDVEVEIMYTAEIRGKVLTGSKIVVVEGKKVDFYSEKVVQYLSEYFKNTDVVYDKLELPETDNYGRVHITWRSLDLSVLSHEGKLITYEPDKTCNMEATIQCYDKIFTCEYTFKTYSKDEIIDFLINRIHRDTLQQYTLGVYAYNAENYGFIPFYIQDTSLNSLVVSTTTDNETITYLEGEHNKNVNKMNIITGLLPWNATGRTQIIKKSTQFITIHDTGDAVQSASDWNEYVSSGADKRQTSWHFTVGENEIFQHVPLEEVAWHAGDGSSEFGLNDTGIKYDGPNPEITLGTDKYLYINGQKSTIFTSWNANDISEAGLYTCLGDNGNYFMANVHTSSYWENTGIYQVCTNGGNRNSVGIETCINKGVDYNRVMRNTSNLVANLLMYYNLEPDRVLYHQHFSGKLCPQVMITNDILYNFHNMIENEYFILKYLPGISITYESNNTDLLDNEGKILKAVNKDTMVSYKVTVSYNGITKSYQKETLIKPNK